MTLLVFIALGVICVIALGRFVSPRSGRRPVRSWSLDDYGTYLRRGLSVFFAAGARNAYRMDRMHEEAKRHPTRAPEGLAIVQGPLDGGPDDPRRKDPDSPFHVDPDRVGDPDHPGIAEGPDDPAAPEDGGGTAQPPRR